MSKLVIKRIAYAVVIVAVLTLIWANRTGRLEPRSYKGEGELIPVSDTTDWPEKTIPVTVGAWVEDISDFDVSAQTFKSSGSVWFIWPADFQALLDLKKIPVDAFFTVANALDGYSVTPIYETPQRLSDGRFYQAFQYTGTFLAFGLDFRRFPFQAVQLPLAFSINAEKFSSASPFIRLIPDEQQSGIGEYVHIPGYVTNGKKMTEWIYHFGTRFGLPPEFSGTEMTGSRVQMTLIYQRSVITSVLKLIFPLVVVMTVVLLSPSLAASLWDVRIALPSTALLTLVFLQQSYADQLPPLPYLTFIDQIYALSYATALAFFALFVWSSNQLETAGENRQFVVQKINRVDLRFQIIFAVGIVVLATLGWFVPVR